LKALLPLVTLAAALLTAAYASPGPADATVDFSKKVVDWDGFGVNYVEAPQTRDYAKNPQEYGGLSTLPEAKREEVLDLVFGEGGLEPGLLKMFLDPWHEGATRTGNDNADPDVLDPARFDHATTTKWMRLFAKEGLARTRARGGDLSIITTLYGPPAWMTKQGFIRGRDLDPAMKRELGEYLVAWVKYLKETEKLPVKYVSLHNEGEDFSRWPIDGRSAGHARHDYNLFWPPSQVVDFLRFLPGTLQKQGMGDVGVANGEPTNWYRFVMWGYAPAIAADPGALAGLGLISSHGFTGGANEWYGGHDGRGVELLRLARPELHAWTTSMTWGKMDAGFVADVWGQIYQVKVNGVIPWAAVQTSKWVGGDPNPGTAIRVLEDCGCYQVLPGYHYYKQVTRAGRPGMYAAETWAPDPAIRIFAFASNGTRHPDAIVVVNTSQDRRRLKVRIAGTQAARFTAFRTSDHEAYAPAGEHAVSNGVLDYEAPDGSVTTFFAR
jgi:O-glycosyl hydrolase